MKHDEYMKWQVQVKDLDEEQAADLLRRMRQLKKLSGNVSTPQEATNDDDWLLDGLVRALKNKGWLSSSSMSRLRNTKGFKRYLRDSPDVRLQLATLIKGGYSNVAGRTTLSYIVGHALVYWVERRKKIPSVAASVVGHVCRSVEAIEEQFPGYIAANLFHLVIGGDDGKNIRADKSGSHKRIARAPRG